MPNKRLLLVEDDRALADLVTFHFERAGYDITRTGDGEEALICFRQHAIPTTKNCWKTSKT